MMVSLLLVWACNREKEAAPELGITIEFPLTEATKADVGEVPALEEENKITDLKIWVFNHETKVLEASYATTNDFPEGGGVRKYALAVTPTFAKDKPNVDVFVLVNSASIGCSGLSANWNSLYTAFFEGDDYFGLTPEKLVKSVPSSGLPMSGLGMDLSLSGEEPTFTLPTVSVVRAVSKLNFVFCQMKTENQEEGEKESFKIRSVELNGNLIPLGEYVFSEDAQCRVVKVAEPYYDSRSIQLNWPQGLTLAENEAPEALSYAGQDGPTYDKMIRDAVTGGTLSRLGTLYLRESDQALTGKINYTITKNEVSEDKETTFEMASAGDFARNHTWTVYGYFISNRTLQLAVNALPWDKNNYTIEFSTASLQVSQKFTVDRSSATVVDIRDGKEFNVFLDYNRPAKGSIFVITPQGGKLEIIPEGTRADLEAFKVTPVEATIDPSHNKGRIDISIERNPNFEGDPTGRTITLRFKAYTPDGDREIDGSSECIDQIYHFYL